MTATKARTSLWSAQTLTASASDRTSATVDLTTGYGAQVDFTLTNLSTGPTIPAQVQVWVANDYNGGSPTLLTKFGGALVGSTTASAVTYFSVEIPIGAESLRLTAGSNTGTDVTVDADISQVTAL